MNAVDAGVKPPLAAADQVLAKLHRAISSEQVARTLVEGGAALAGALTGAVAVLAQDRRVLRVVYATGDVTGRAIADGRLPLSANFPLSDAVRSGQELWLSNPDQLVERYPDATPSNNSYAWAVLPLMIDRVILGAVGWSFPSHGPSSLQRAHLRSLAQAGDVALYRAGVFDAERHARMTAERERDEIVLQDRMMSAVSSTLDKLVDSKNGAMLLNEVARIVLPRLGDWCGINVIDDEGGMRQIASAHIDPSKEHLLQHISPFNTRSGCKLPGGLKKGRPVLIQALSDQFVRGARLNRGQMRAFRTAGLENLAFLALRIHGQTLGTLCFASGDPNRRYSPADLALADRIARRCAALLEYTRLHEAAEHANEAREEFVAAASHELRTPLSHIKGFVSTLLKTDARRDPVTVHDFLDEIEHEADRLAQLVETLLDMSRIDAGGLDPAARAPTGPAALVYAGIDRIRASLGEHRLEIVVPADLPPVWADVSQVERVIANLLDNAAKYSPPGQPISIAAGLAGASVMFRVEDRGPGILYLERVFEPFFREPTGQHSSKPGSGLGLAICRSIVRSQGGRIWAEQRAGGGSSLVFTLPVVARSGKG